MSEIELLQGAVEQLSSIKNVLLTINFMVSCICGVILGAIISKLYYYFK